MIQIIINESDCILDQRGCFGPAGINMTWTNPEPRQCLNKFGRQREKENDRSEIKIKVEKPFCMFNH